MQMAKKAKKAKKFTGGAGGGVGRLEKAGMQAPAPKKNKGNE